MFAKETTGLEPSTSDGRVAVNGGTNPREFYSTKAWVPDQSRGTSRRTQGHFALLVITGLLFVCTIDDFLSLHDIEADYVSPAALQYLGAETSAALPSWTETRLEWASFKISYMLRAVLIVLNFVILVHLMRQSLARGEVGAQS